jgi:FtsP/CotA-like multicopper oxidase with cupredoxin domain
VPRGKTDCLDSLSKIDDHHFELRRSDAANACDGTGSANDISGMIEVKLKFDGSQLSAYDDGTGHLHHAKFVYHCHILEHEDKGMMAGITVIDPNVYH